MDLHPIERAKEILDKAKIPFCLMASTLLGIYRDGNPIGPIFEFAVLAKDMEEGMERLEKIYPVECKRKNEMGLAIVDLKGLQEHQNNNFEIHLVYFENGYSFHNLGGDQCLVWPKEIWEKQNWEKAKWNGKKWNIPGQVERYLAMYYGTNWREPQKFNWGNAPNLFVLRDVKAGNIYFDELTAYLK